MKFQPTIAKQGLFLIILPLIFEITFVFTLWTQLRHADEERAKIARSREFVAEMMDLTKDFLDAGICLGAWKSTRSNEFGRQFDTIIGNLPEVWNKLNILSADDPDRQRHVVNLRAFGNQILNLISGFRKPSGLAMLILMDPTEYRHKVASAYQGFMNETIAVAKEERERQNRSPANEQRIQTAFAWTLLIGIMINILVSLFMVRVFSLRITRRLSILTDNCRRFVKRQALNNPVGGNDEIADLDLHVHEMANDVRMAEQKRDEYVQMVNHDLRAPLTAIQTVLAGTMKGLYGELSDKGKTRIADARQDAGRLLDLINEAMEADRIESGQFKLNSERFDCTDLIAEVISASQPLTEQKQITIDFKPVPTPIFADRPRLHRVIANLLDNAIKFAPNGTKIEITSNSSPQEVLVEIKDEGPGVPADDAELIFKAYERGHGQAAQQKPGKGLGLAICKAIVEAHGGRIGAKPRTTRGSVFWFAIPSR